MKRKGNIYSNIIDKENIKQAILKASNKKRNRKNVIKILDNIDYYVDYLHNILKNKTFKVSPCQEMKIKDGMKKKERIIYKPRFFPDQCVHWAVMLQLEKIFKRGMYYYCCASIKGRGILHGTKYLKNILKKDLPIKKIKEQC